VYAGRLAGERALKSCAREVGEGVAQMSHGVAQFDRVSSPGSPQRRRGASAVKWRLQNYDSPKIVTRTSVWLPVTVRDSALPLRRTPQRLPSRFAHSPD
jgi:hypothetical protein